jgi:hypothetical protein
VEQQPTTDIVLVHIRQASDPDAADLGIGTGRGTERHVEQVRCRTQRHRRQVNLGERVARLANCRQQPLLRRHHVSGDRRRSRVETELVAGRRRYVPLDGHTPEVKQRTQLEVRLHLDRRVGRGVPQQVGQIGLVDWPAGDRDRRLALVVAKAVQRGLEPADIVPCPDDQRERAYGRLLAQRDQLRRTLQRLVQRCVPSRLQGNCVRLGIGGQGAHRSQQQCRYDRHNEQSAHSATVAGAALRKRSRLRHC